MITDHSHSFSKFALSISKRHREGEALLPPGADGDPEGRGGRMFRATEIASAGDEKREPAGFM